MLSYVVPYDFTRKGAKSGMNPLIEIQTAKRFKSNVDDIQFSNTAVDYMSKADSRGTTRLSVVTIEIADNWLSGVAIEKQEPFLRIDGNHRLSAAKSFHEEVGITELVAPFCLILLPPEAQPKLEEGATDAPKKREPTKFEKTVFHNINSKSVPLTSEEIYKVIIDDGKHFPDKELSSRADFGIEYLFTRKIKDKIIPGNFPSIAYLLYDHRDDVSYVRTVLVDFFSLARHYKMIDTKFINYSLVERTFKKVEQRYEDYKELKQSKAMGLLVAFLYFTFKDEKFNLDWFTNWVSENHIYELNQVSPADLIAIFEKILLSKHRTIFISMQFNDSICENHFEFIKTIIEEINNETKANIKIFPLRIDRFKDGSAYKIPDAILDRIFDSGLLIGDLTKNNSNVYHEIGYLMGLQRLRNRKKINLILICNTTVHSDFPNNIGFNIRNHKILPFHDTNNLKEPLKEEIKSYYFKS